MIKLLIGGSPCTFWSVAQTKNRETEAEGLGWELFKNYLIAKEKFKPDFFLYENNKSAAQAIKDQIARELGVELMYINSALVSAQNRQRFYAFNWHVDQPEDRGIYLSDILEGFNPNYENEAVCLRYERTETGKALRKQYEAHEIHHGFNEHRVLQPRDDGKTNTLSTVLKDNQVAVSVGVGYRNRREDDGKLYRRFETSGEPKANALTTVQTDSMVAESIRISGSEAQNEKSDLYAVPFNETKDGKSYALTASYHKASENPTSQFGEEQRRPRVVQTWNGEDKPIYEVINGEIEIKGKKYPIKLPDGHYIIRKLTPVECERLQTLPDGYTAAVSATQRYRGLGNGWTAEVIIHILTGVLKDVPRDEEIVVLSMYDGIGTGRYCLKKMGFTNVTYYAYEIDKAAMKVALSNYPDIIQLGDAFALRRDDWELGKKFDDEVIVPPAEEGANDTEGQTENNAEKEEKTDDDSQSGADPKAAAPTARGAAPSDSEGSVREPSDPGGVRDVEEGEGTEAEADEPDGSGASGEDGEIDPAVRAIEEMQRSAEDLLKLIIIRDFESAMRKSGIEPDKELIEKLRASSLMDVSKASLGFAGYIATAALNNSIKNS